MNVICFIIVLLKINKNDTLGFEKQVRFHWIVLGCYVCGAAFSMNDE